MHGKLSRRWLLGTVVGALLIALPAVAQPRVMKVQLVNPETLANFGWHSLATDPQGDGLYPRLPDAKELFYALDRSANRLWLKVTTWNPLPEHWFGINVAFDIDGNPDNGGTWWGTNKFKYDRLASAYLFQADGYWQGVVGVADSDAAGRFVFNNLSRDVKAAVDRNQQAIFIGVPITTFGPAHTIRLIATVGSMLNNNDDIPNAGAVTINLTPSAAP